ncbi:MAG: DUF3899 domain-containing protein [Bacillus sp. (in: firmicutes)]|jgi:hypothetical protein
MKHSLKKKFFILALTQLLIVIISFISNKEISLLSYINISFYISAILLLTSLLLYTIHSGFYDVIGKSFNLAFTRGENKRRFDEIPALSELITFDQKPLLFYGIINGLFMLCALCLYYL